ncbi:MAG: uroporphyrinogen-III synthase [Balneola sp.]
MPKILFTHKIKAKHLDELKHAKFEFADIPFIDVQIKGFDIEKVKEINPDAWVFTSKKAVKSVAQKLDNLEIPKFVFAVGSSTSKKLRELNIKALYPKNFTSARVAEKIIEYPVKKVIHFCGNLSDSVLQDLLKAKDCLVNKIEVYETVLTSQKVNTEEFDAVVFLSPSAFTSFCKLNDPDKLKTVFCIGSTTAEAVKKSYERLIVTPDNYTFADLIETINQKYKNVIS